MLRRTALTAGIVALTLVVLLAVLASAGPPLIRHLTRVRDPVAAKRNGGALARLRNQTVVVVIGHPDDAEYYTGGLLAMLVRHDNRVVVIDGTSGEKGGNGIPNLARVRESEQRAAGRIEGYDRIVFARNPDRGLENNAHFRGQLRQIFEQERPAVLVTFDAEREALGYRHRDHFYAGQASLQVARELGTVRLAYLFSTASPNVVVDVSRYSEIKSRARAAHVSQHRGRSGILGVLGLLRLGRGGSREETRTGRAGANRDSSFSGGSETYRLVRLGR